MEPSVLGSAFMEGGPDRKIKLDRSPGVDEVSRSIQVLLSWDCTCGVSSCIDIICFLCSSHHTSH